jgi:hypothetical protein
MAKAGRRVPITVRNDGDINRTDIRGTVMPSQPAQIRPETKVERRFESSRLQAQFVAAAYEALIPVLKHPLPSGPNRATTPEHAIISTEDIQSIGA